MSVHPKKSVKIINHAGRVESRATGLACGYLKIFCLSSNIVFSSEAIKPQLLPVVDLIAAKESAMRKNNLTET